MQAAELAKATGERAAAQVPQLAAVLASADRRCYLHFDIARGWAQAGVTGTPRRSTT
ncbi:MAG TPA: hypothetical protein VN327_09970 [Pseudonocardiaceae bacterium]|nr:hypothetical protein [Pseudonocardiaceae bacterium]